MANGGLFLRQPRGFGYFHLSPKASAAIRMIGNFAAHPMTSTNTGEVVDVEPGEAEFLLSVLEELLDYYFVRPARRHAINAKRWMPISLN